MNTQKNILLAAIAAVSLFVSVGAAAGCCGGGYSSSCPCTEEFYQGCDSGCASTPDNCPTCAAPTYCEGCSYNETYTTPPLNNSCSTCNGDSY